MARLFFSRQREPQDEMPFTSVYLVVGLGNPGREYRDSRHNVGFMVIDQLAEDLSIRMTRVQNKSIVGTGNIDGVKVVLVKPKTFMNLSGSAVASLVRFYKIPLDCVLVIHDDIDLPFGTLRLRPGGGSAGQKGVQSIIERLGTEQFPRLRVGVGRPPGRKEGAHYVLQNFSKAEWDELRVILKEAAEAVKVFICHGIDQAMNHFNHPIFEE